MYIVFEGSVGVGKTEQSRRFAQFLRDHYPNRKVIWTREPGGSEIADSVRAVVQANEFTEEMEPMCEAYLYAASRAQTLRSIVRPCLNAGGIVVADRSFITSLAYQAVARGLGLETVWNINKTAIGNIYPDLVVYLDMPIAAALARARDQAGDKFERKDEAFFKDVRRGYEIAACLPLLEKKWVTVNAEGDIECVFDRVLQAVKPRIEAFL